MKASRAREMNLFRTLGKAVRSWRLLPASIMFLGAAFATGCRQDMQDQPKYLVYRESSFFKDGSAMRHPPAGTIARGYLDADKEYYTGKSAQTSLAAKPGQNALTSEAEDVGAFPFPVTDEVMTRGRQRFEIYCSVCHGMTGQGDGMVVRRGFRKPPLYTDPRLLASPVGHYFDVITNGWGAMPSYSQQIPVADRWSIIAYIRALQRSQVGFTGIPSASPSPSAGPGSSTAAPTPKPQGSANSNSNSAPIAPGTGAQAKPGGRK